MKFLCDFYYAKMFNLKVILLNRLRMTQILHENAKAEAKAVAILKI